MFNQKMTENDVRFKQEANRHEPFPPSYYETERNAKAKLAQMMNPPKKVKHM